VTAGGRREDGGIDQSPMCTNKRKGTAAPQFRKKAIFSKSPTLDENQEIEDTAGAAQGSTIVSE
jgi:hypothetical protein